MRKLLVHVAAFLGCPNDHVYLEENFRITF